MCIRYLSRPGVANHYELPALPWYPDIYHLLTIFHIAIDNVVPWVSLDNTPMSAK